MTGQVNSHWYKTRNVLSFTRTVRLVQRVFAGNSILSESFFFCLRSCFLCLFNVCFLMYKSSRLFEVNNYGNKQLLLLFVFFAQFFMIVFNAAITESHWVFETYYQVVCILVCHTMCSYNYAGVVARIVNYNIGLMIMEKALVGCSNGKTS